MIDENYICGRCSGTIIPIGEDSGVKVFECSVCGIGTQFECKNCKNPRTVIDDEGNCMFCSGEQNIGSFYHQIKKDLSQKLN